MTDAAPPYRLLYHPAIRSEDIPRINRNLRKRIACAIQTRLKTEPQQYGEPLKRTLKGHWKLRVGDYRVVFRILRKEVWIYGIIHRRDVYKRIAERLSSQ